MGIVQIRRRFKCVVQQNGRNTEYVFNKALIIINDKKWCLSFFDNVSNINIK